MNEEYDLKTLATGVGVALAIVFTVIIVINLPEIIHIIGTEGLLN